MSVLKGEGRVPILYATYALPVGRSRPAYLARPDVSGTHPTVVVAHSSRGLNSHAKSVCRRLARYGFAAICPDLFGGLPLGEGDLEAMDVALSNAGEAAHHALVEGSLTAATPGTPWASGDRIGVLGLGAGGSVAVDAAVEGRFDAIALVDPSIDTLNRAAESELPVLAVVGEANGHVSIDEVRTIATRSSLPVAIYAGMGHEFLDEGNRAYDRPAAEDALDRIVEFFEANL